MIRVNLKNPESKVTRMLKAGLVYLVTLVSLIFILAAPQEIFNFEYPGWTGLIVGFVSSLVAINIARRYYKRENPNK